MADNQLQVILDEQGVAKENAQQLLEAFGAPFTEAGEILAEYKNIVVTKEDDFETMAVARSKRLALKEIRVGVEKKRKELKEDSLRTGRAIDSVAKFVKENIEPAEKHLEEQEKFAEIKQAERAAATKARRIESLMAYTDDLALYNLDEMTEEQYQSLLTSLKSQHEAKLAEAKRIEDERIAKEKADAEEHERIRKENERLKAEAEAKEKADRKEREKREIEQAKKDAEAKAEADRIQKEADEKVAAERAERERLEQEKRDLQEKEAKAKADAEEQQRQALLAPDKEKLLAFASMIDSIELPALASKDAQAVLNNVEELLGKVSTYIRGNVKGL